MPNERKPPLSSNNLWARSNKSGARSDKLGARSENLVARSKKLGAKESWGTLEQLRGTFREHLRRQIRARRSVAKSGCN